MVTSVPSEIQRNHLRDLRPDPSDSCASHLRFPIRGVSDFLIGGYRSEKKMNYEVRHTAAGVVASASDFIMQGRGAAPAVSIEGSFSEALASQNARDKATSSKPLTVALLNTRPGETRIAWFMNNFETDERFTHAWSVARKVMVDEPIDLPLEIERQWQKRVTKNW
jgi:hypothetical protein